MGIFFLGMNEYGDAQYAYYAVCIFRMIFKVCNGKARYVAVGCSRGGGVRIFLLGMQEDERGGKGGFSFCECRSMVVRYMHTMQ